MVEAIVARTSLPPLSKYQLRTGHNVRADYSTSVSQRDDTSAFSSVKRRWRVDRHPIWSGSVHAYAAVCCVQQTRDTVLSVSYSSILPAFWRQHTENRVNNDLLLLTSHLS